MTSYSGMKQACVKRLAYRPKRHALSPSLLRRSRVHLALCRMAHAMPIQAGKRIDEAFFPKDEALRFNLQFPTNLTNKPDASFDVVGDARNAPEFDRSYQNYRTRELSAVPTTSQNPKDMKTGFEYMKPVFDYVKKGTKNFGESKKDPNLGILIHDLKKLTSRGNFVRNSNVRPNSPTKKGEIARKSLSGIDSDFFQTYPKVDPKRLETSANRPRSFNRHSDYNQSSSRRPRRPSRRPSSSEEFRKPNHNTRTRNQPWWTSNYAGRGKRNLQPKEALPFKPVKKRAVRLDKLTAFSERNNKPTHEIQQTTPVLPLACTMRELSALLGKKVVNLVQTAVKLGLSDIKDAASLIKQEAAELIAIEHDILCNLETAIERDVHTRPDEHIESYPVRPPLVCVMGHVDHGKTTLLDRFRDTHVAEHESGGITQSIGAFPVPVPNPGMITMFDTPGHAAFNSMRSRGANLVDTVLLVVAADEGVKPQTLESIRLARNAHVPLVVAINKIDRPGSNPEQVVRQLRKNGVIHEDDGGDTPMVECSALTGEGVDDLLKTVTLVAEMQEPRAEVDCNAEAITLETAVDAKRGSVANVLVRKGTLKVGDYFVVDNVCGKVKRMTDHNNKPIKEAGPSFPVTVYGLNDVVGVGKDFIVVDDEAMAKSVIEYRLDQERYKKMNEELWDASKMEENENKELLVMIKGNTLGSVEALTDYVNMIQVPEDSIDIKVMKSSVGAVTESDVRLANDLGAAVLGFDVSFANGTARKAAKSLKVPTITNSVIFKVMDDFCDLLTERLPEQHESVVVGSGIIKQLFHLNGRNSAGVKPVVAGCHVESGKFVHSHGYQVLRNGYAIFEQHTPAASLKHFKEKVEEVNQGKDCGLDLGEFTTFEVGDKIKCIEQVKRTQRVVPPTFASDQTSSNRKEFR